MGSPDRRDVRLHGVGREVVDVAVATGGQHDGMGGVRADLTREQVAGDDADGTTVLDDDIEHLDACVHRHGAELHLPGEGLIRAEQQLLTRLTPRIERAGDLGASERPVVEETAVLPGERHALRGSLVDDLVRDLSEPVDVRLAGAVVAALDRVVEEAVDAVAVVAVVLGGVDAALGGDGVSPACGVVKGEDVDVVAELAQRGGGGGAGQPSADDDDAVLALVRRVHQLDGEPVVVPAVLDRARGNLAVECDGHALFSRLLTRLFRTVWRTAPLESRRR